MTEHALIVGAGGGSTKGGAGGAALAPAEVPDSLHSQAYVEVLYALGEGPMAGPVDGFASIIIDGVPAANNNDSHNFPGLTVDLRYGTQDQTPISSASIASDEEAVGVQVTHDSPVVMDVTDDNADAAVVTIGFPKLAYQNPDNGQVGGASVTLKFQLQSNGGGWFDQRVGYGPVASRRVNNRTVQANSTAFVCSFRLVGSGRYQKIHMEVSPDGGAWHDYGHTELFWDDKKKRCVGGGLVRWNAGAPFYVRGTHVAGDESDFRFESWRFLGPSYAHIVEGKTLSRYQQQIRIPFGNRAPPFQVGVVRVSPDNLGPSTVAETWVDSFRTEIDDKFGYPNTVLALVKYPVDQFSAVPKTLFDFRWLQIQIPSNYDPYRRTYSGAWNGTFKFQWSDNPAWCFYALVTNRRWGCGDRGVPVDKWALYEIGQYCDGLVPNGRGGWEPRFSCNLSIENELDAYQAIQTMAAIFRGMAYVVAGTLIATCDKPADAQYLFTNANVAGGRFAYEGSSLAARHTVAYVSYLDPDNPGEAAVEPVYHRPGIARYGVNVLRLDARWIRSRREAIMAGEWALETENRCHEVVTFSPSSAECAYLVPGDIVLVSDEHRIGAVRGGRIVAMGDDYADLDQEIEIYAGVTNQIKFHAVDGSVVTRSLFNAPGFHTRVYFPNTGVSAVEYAIWTVSAIGRVEPRPYRILDIAQEGGLIGSISALAHDPGLYAHIERDLPLVNTPYSTIRPGQQEPARNIAISEELYFASDRSIRARLLVTWDKPDGAIRYAVAYQHAQSNWRWVPDSISGESWELDDAKIGYYRVRVVAINAIGVKAPFAQGEGMVYGKTAKPPNVTTFRVVALDDGKRRAVFRIKDPPIDLAGYQLRYLKGVAASGDFERMHKLHSGVIQSSPWDFYFPQRGDYTFAIVGVDTSGNISNAARFRTLTLPDPEVKGRVILSRSERDLAWPGESYDV